MQTAKRILKNVDVQFISLVDKGANQKSIVWKGEGEPTFQKTVAIVKTDDEKQMVYGLVYAPDEVDSHGDSMTAAEIEKAAQGFMKAARTGQIDLQHNYQAGEGFVAESWIVKAGDPLFQEEGAWAVGIKIEKAETWEAIKKGDIAGLSMAGQAVAETLQKDGIVKRMAEWFAARMASAAVEKDFNSEMEKQSLWTAVQALWHALDDIMYERYDLSLDEKRAAMQAEAEKFTLFLNTKQTTMTKAETTPNAPDAPGIEAQIQKAVEAAVKPLQEQIEKLSGTTPAAEPAPAPSVEDLQKQLAEATAENARLKGQSAGRQGAESREVEKSDQKGIRFF